jgi:hypothetical protein
MALLRDALALKATPVSDGGSDGWILELAVAE